MRKLHIFLITAMLSVSVLFTSVGFAQLSRSLSVHGNISATIPNDIFISNITLKSANNATEEINAYALCVMNSTVYLSSNADSQISYTVEFYNNADKDMAYIGTVVHEDAYDNDAITFTISGVTEAQVIGWHQYMTLTITFSYKDGVSANRVLNSLIGFQFGEVVILEEEEEQEKDDGTFTPGESYNTLVSQLLSNSNRYGLNDSHKGYVVHNTLKDVGVMYSGTHANAGNLDKFYQALQVKDSASVDFALQYVSETQYIAYLHLRTDSAQDAIKVYKQYLNYNASTKKWELGIALVGYAPTTYISSVSHYGILPEDWQPGALPTE